MKRSSCAGGPGADPGPESGPGPTGEASKGTSSWRYKAIFVLAVLLLALATVPSPRVPTEADQESTADASWCAVLEYAHQHGLQFGTDIIFTYGPLGFLATPYLFSTAAGARFAIDVSLALVTALSVCFIARRLRIPWAIALIAVYLLLASNIYPRTDLLLELNLLCWGILCTVATGPRLVIYGLTLAGVAVFASLVKITLLIMAVMTIVVVSCDLLLRNNRRLSLGLVGLFLCGFVVAWLGAGQNALQLGVFLRRALITSLGYNNAMAYEGSVVLRGRAILTGLLAVATIITARRNSPGYLSCPFWAGSMVSSVPTSITPGSSLASLQSLPWPGGHWWQAIPQLPALHRLTTQHQRARHAASDSFRHPRFWRARLR